MSKLPKVGATIFSVMTQMANEHKAINLAQGFPNFPVDERLSKFMDVGANSPLHQYAPMGGSPKLIEEIVRLNEEKYGTRFAGGEEILVTAGAAQAIFTAIQALIYPGDEVIMLDPAYDCYDPAVALVGAKGIHINLNDEFKPDWEAVNSSVH
jgi:methionine aminotransferase